MDEMPPAEVSVDAVKHASPDVAAKVDKDISSVADSTTAEIGEVVARSSTFVLRICFFRMKFRLSRPGPTWLFASGRTGRIYPGPGPVILTAS